MANAFQEMIEEEGEMLDKKGNEAAAIDPVDGTEPRLG